MSVNPPPDPSSTEPAMKTAIVTGALSILAVLTAFNLPITDGQQNAIVGAVGFFGPLIAGWVIRNKVFSGATVARMLERQ